MAGIPAGLPAGVRLSDHISLGVIARAVPPERVRQVLAETGKASERERDLPAPVMVYYAIALALYMGSSTREVLRCLLEGLRWLWGAEAVRVAGKSGISQARRRLGEAPLRRLYEGLVQPIATPASKGAWYRDWRLVLQPELRRSSPFPMAFAGSLLMPAAPARPEVGGLAVRRLGPDQVPEQTAHFRHGERQQVGFEIDRAFFPRPRYSGSRRDRRVPASLA